MNKILVTYVSLLSLAAGTTCALAASASSPLGGISPYQGASKLIMVSDSFDATKQAQASATQLLYTAQDALSRQHTAAADNALERAETRMLNHAETLRAAQQPDRRPVIDDISQARQALRNGDVATASRLVAQALTSSTVVSSISDRNETHSAAPAIDSRGELAQPGPFGTEDPSIAQVLTTGQGTAYGLDAKRWGDILDQGPPGNR